MKISIIDTETTGFLEDPSSNIIEFAIVTWDTEKGIIFSMSFLINSLKENEQISNEITELTGLDTFGIIKNGHNVADSVDIIEKFLNESQYVMAANSKFDKGMLERLFNIEKKCLPELHWIDFLSDIEFPKEIKGRSVNHIAADHGIVNPFAHRALPDCLTLVAILERGKYDIEKIIEISKEPQITVRAVVSFDQKDEAKKHGFYWNGKEKNWYKIIRESQYEELKYNVSFQIVKGN